MTADERIASGGSGAGGTGEPAIDDAASSRAHAAPLVRRLEAVLMIADEPQSAVLLAAGLGAPVSAVREALAALAADLDGEAADGAVGVRRGFELREVGGGWRFYVREELDPVVADFVAENAPTRLSQAALETLAVIAYLQPVARSRVASVRAVNVDSVVRTLLARGLVAEADTDPETGAIRYATTDLLLAQLGVDSLEALPPISPLLPDGADGFDADAR